MNRQSFGTGRTSIVDRFGTWLSRRAILRAVGEGRNLHVLELGCGYAARNLLAIEDRAQTLVGVDFNISERLSRLEKFEAIEQPIERALEGLRNRKFDVILLISVLEHLWDPVEALRACRDMLNPGGVVLVNVPTWAGKVFLEFSAFRLGFSPREEMDDHKMYYDKRDLWPVLVRAGFRPSCISLAYHKFRLNLFAVVRAEPIQ